MKRSIAAALFCLFATPTIAAEPSPIFDGCKLWSANPRLCTASADALDNDELVEYLLTNGAAMTCRRFFFTHDDGTKKCAAAFVALIMDEVKQDTTKVTKKGNGA